MKIPIKGDVLKKVTPALLMLLCLIGPGISHGQEGDTESVQFCPYWYVDNTTESRLEISNNSDERRYFTPTLMANGGRLVILNPIAVDPGGRASLDLRVAVQPLPKESKRGTLSRPERWGDGSRSGSVWGSARLSGSSFVGIHAWIVVNEFESGLSVNSMFDSARTDSSSLVSMWWHPTPRTEEFFVLQNTGKKQIKVRSTFVLNGQVLNGRSFRIQPGSSYLGSVGDLMRKRDLDHGSLESGSVRFDIVGKDKKIAGFQGVTKRAGFQGITMVFDEGVGFSSPLHMHRPETGLSSQLQLAGVLKGTSSTDLGLPPYANFSPFLLLTNLTAEEVLVDVTMRTPSTLVEEVFDGETVKSVVGSEATGLARIHLRPHDDQVVSLANLKGVEDVPDGIVGLEIVHNGNEAGVLAEVLSTDETFNYAFYDPLSPVGGKRLSMTTVSFDLAADRNKIIVVKNTAEFEVTAGISVYYDDANGIAREYQANRFLSGQGLFVVDLKDLRDSGQPDVQNRVLPHDLETGHVVVAASSPSVIASDLAFDGSGSIASCFGPCECDPLCPAVFCPIIPIPPPTLIRQFNQTYNYEANPTGSACVYNICPSGAPPAACNASSFSAPLQPLPGMIAPGCWASASQAYTIQHWAQTDWAGNLLFSYATCAAAGSPNYGVFPCF